MPLQVAVTVPPWTTLAAVTVRTGVNAESEGCSAKVAVTACAALIVTMQVPVPVQPPPLQPVKVEPAAGVAVRVTAAPLVKAAEHVVPQETPAGALVMVPAPAPALLTVSVKDCTANVAVTAWAALIVTVHVLVPVQP